MAHSTRLSSTATPSRRSSGDRSSGSSIGPMRSSCPRPGPASLLPVASTRRRRRIETGWRLSWSCSRPGRPGGARLGRNPRRGASHEPPRSDSQLGLRRARRVRARLRLASPSPGVAAGGAGGSLGAGDLGRRSGATTRGDVGPRDDRAHGGAGRGGHGPRDGHGPSSSCCGRHDSRRWPKRTAPAERRATSRARAHRRRRLRASQRDAGAARVGSTAIGRKDGQLAGVGHWWPEETPAPVAEALTNFWAQLPDAAGVPATDSRQ